MFLIDVEIQILVESINVWNNEYSLSLVVQGQDEKYVVWSVENVLITGIEIAPSKIMFEFDNFNLQGLTPRARQVADTLVQLVQQSFSIEDHAGISSRIYGVGERQLNRTLRTFPVVLADALLDVKTEAEFKASLRERQPDMTGDELDVAWENYCELVGQERDRKDEQERWRVMTADEAAEEWWSKRGRLGNDVSETGPIWSIKQASEKIRLQVPLVTELIHEWVPKGRFRTEEAYEAALAEYLVGQGISAPEQQGASLVDILASQGIAVEIKLTPGRSEYDRLCGQIMRQLEEFGIVVVLIIRPDKRDLLDEYQNRFDGDERVVFINKP